MRDPDCIEGKVAMHVRLIRHGMTAGNAARRYVGKTDEPLCPEGRTDAEKKPKDFALGRVYVSPLKRARAEWNDMRDIVKVGETGLGNE
jgi:bisphosphoglycerate-dependent phosphoglycerate mutase